MWTLIIIIAIVLGLFLCVKIVFVVDDRRYYKEHKDIFEAHRRIGYPKLTTQQQFDILDRENVASVSSLTEFNFVPSGLLEYYINIEPDDYLEHVHSLNLKEKLKFNPNDIRDGFFISQEEQKFEYIFVDRNHIDFRKSFGSYDKLLRYIVYTRLKLHAPRKYRKLSKKYYA